MELNLPGNLTRIAYNGILVLKFNESFMSTLRPGKFDRDFLKSDNRSMHSVTMNQPIHHNSKGRSVVAIFSP